MVIYITPFSACKCCERSTTLDIGCDAVGGEVRIYDCWGEFWEDVPETDGCEWKESWSYEYLGGDIMYHERWEYVKSGDGKSLLANCHRCNAGIASRSCMKFHNGTTHVPTGRAFLAFVDDFFSI